VNEKSSGGDDVMIWKSAHDDCYVHSCPLIDPEMIDVAGDPCRLDDCCSCHDAKMIPLMIGAFAFFVYAPLPNLIPKKMTKTSWNPPMQNHYHCHCYCC